MDTVRFSDQYDMLAQLQQQPASELRARDAANQRLRGRWLAVVDDSAVGAITAWLRPDDRVFLTLAGDSADAAGLLVDVAAQSLGGPVFASVDAADHDIVAALEAAGFVTALETDVFTVPFARALGWLRRAWLPGDVQLVPADGVDHDRLFELDNEIRNDVPGIDGWRGDRNWFSEELTDSPPFDPSAYLVAIDRRNDRYCGLVRIWRNPSGPRLGLIGVVRSYRHTTIAAALLRASLTAAAEWGHDAFTAETSTSNLAIHPRLVRLGAQRTGRLLQMVRS